MALVVDVVVSGKTGNKVRQKNGIERGYVIPTDTQSPRKSASNAAMSFASGDWEAGVAAGKAPGWDDYAANTVKLNRIGQNKLRTGREFFIATNQFLLNAGQPIQEDAPTTPGFAAPWSYTVAPADGIDMIIENVVGIGDPGDVFQIQVSAPWKITKNTFDGRTTSTVIGTDLDIDGLVIRPAAEVSAGSVFFIVGTRLDSTGKLQNDKNIVRAVVSI